MECVSCEIELKGRPCIFVDFEPYCFKCAKQYERDLIASTDSEYKRKLKAYEAKRAAFKKVHPDFDTEMPFIDWSDFLAGFLGWLAFPVIGMIVSVMLWQVVRRKYWNWEQGKLFKEFDSKNPMPCPPNPVQIDLKLDESHFTEPVTERNYRLKVLQRDESTCQNCDEQKDESELEVHHIQMRSKDGTDHPTNLITLCLHCHDRESWFGHKRKLPTTFGLK